MITHQEHLKVISAEDLYESWLDSYSNPPQLMAAPEV